MKFEIDSSGYISIADYFLGKPHTLEHTEEAVKLLVEVNALLTEYSTQGGVPQIDPDTGTYISGSQEGWGDGGFRTPDSITGSARSAHREAKAVDVYDLDNLLDTWITDMLLERYNLYREHQDYTLGWVHLQTRAPKSGNRTFIP